MQLLSEEVIKLNQIKEAHNIQAQVGQERMMFLSAINFGKIYKVQSNERSTNNLSTRPAIEDSFFSLIANTAIKSYKVP